MTVATVRFRSPNDYSYDRSRTRTDSDPTPPTVAPVRMSTSHASGGGDSIVSAGPDRGFIRRDVEVSLSERTSHTASDTTRSHRSPSVAIASSAASAVVVPSPPARETTPIMRGRSLRSGEAAGPKPGSENETEQRKEHSIIPGLNQSTNPFYAMFETLKESSQPFLFVCAIQFFCW